MSRQSLPLVLGGGIYPVQNLKLLFRVGGLFWEISISQKRKRDMGDTITQQEQIFLLEKREELSKSKFSYWKNGEPCINFFGPPFIFSRPRFLFNGERTKGGL